MSNVVALQPAVVAGPRMVRLTINYDGDQVDLADPVSFDSTDEQLKAFGVEALRTAGKANADLTNFVVYRTEASETWPEAHVAIRPKVTFGT